MKTKLIAYGLGAMFLATSCSNDEIESVNNGNEITFNTQINRATSTTTDNLKEFQVWAYGTNFDSKMFIDGKIASRDGETNYFKFDSYIFWPSDVPAFNFWALSPANLAGVTVNTGTQQIENFTPDADVTKQIDLVGAYTVAQRSAGTSVKLVFNHTLSQIEVKAKAGVDDDESRTVKIKGAWIMNVRKSGTLKFDLTQTDLINHLNWTAGNVKTFYGVEFNDAKTLSSTATNLLSETDGSNTLKTNLMVVPQQLDTWNIDDSSDKTTNQNDGAYIILLCRIEATHPGSLHNGSTDESVQPGGTAENPTHTHQLFPYTGTFDGEQYGYTCVPINTKWEPGKKYVYTLSFVGKASGAGIYPPADAATTLNLGNSNYISTIPEGKNVGDPVLDNPIIFDVTVDPWDDEWNNGNVDMK